MSKDLNLHFAYRAAAPNTRKAYKACWKELNEWLDGKKLNDNTLSLFLRSLHKRGLAPSTIKMYRAATTFHTKALEMPHPIGLKTKLAWKEIVREGSGRGRGKASALSINEFKKWLPYVNSITRCLGYGMRL